MHEQNDCETHQDERNEVQNLRASHLLEGGVQEIFGRIRGDVQRVPERPARTPQPEPPRKVASDPPQTRGCEYPPLRLKSGTHGSPEQGAENDSAEERSDEDRRGCGMREEHEEGEEKDGDPARPSLPRIGEEPKCRCTEEERDEIVDVANERAKVQRRCRDHRHRHEDQWVSSKAVSDRRQRKDQQDLAAGHEQCG